MWGLHVFDDRCGEQTRRALGDEAFQAAYRDGAALTLDAAVTYALGERPEQGASGRGASDDGLTRREREVARLIARGLTNKQIAETLVIAHRTAESHVEHIMGKLGFDSRAQIAAWTADRFSASAG